MPSRTINWIRASTGPGIRRYVGAVAGLMPSILPHRPSARKGPTAGCDGVECRSAETVAARSTSWSRTSTDDLTRRCKAMERAPGATQAPGDQRVARVGEANRRPRTGRQPGHEAGRRRRCRWR